jgi:hypothetical protein
MILTRPVDHGVSTVDASLSPAAASRRPAHLLRPLLLIFLAALVAVTSGCASYLGAQVTSFHQADGKRLAGRSFVITPTKEQAESLEFRTYADLLRDSLVRQGLVASTPPEAELEVTMRYTVDGGKAVTYGYPAYGYSYVAYDPFWGWGPYYGPHGHFHYMWAPYPVAYGYAQSIVYRRELRVEITERRPGKDASGGGRLFEGTVVSEGESSSIAPVMPAMMHALFSDFPGPSGVSRRVQVRLDDAPAATR